MGRRATMVTLDDGRRMTLAGEPMLDTSEGVLIVTHEDGTSRVINWDFVTDYYYMTEAEFAAFLGEQNDDGPYI